MPDPSRYDGRTPEPPYETPSTEDFQAAHIESLLEALKPWGSGGIITGTVLAWIAVKDPTIAKAIVYGKAAVDRALNPSCPGEPMLNRPPVDPLEPYGCPSCRNEPCRCDLDLLRDLLPWMEAAYTCPPQTPEAIQILERLRTALNS